ENTERKINYKNKGVDRPRSFRDDLREQSRDCLQRDSPVRELNPRNLLPRIELHGRKTWPPQLFGSDSRWRSRPSFGTPTTSTARKHRGVSSSPSTAVPT